MDCLQRGVEALEQQLFLMDKERKRIAATAAAVAAKAVAALSKKVAGGAHYAESKRRHHHRHKSSQPNGGGGDMGSGGGSGGNGGGGGGVSGKGGGDGRTAMASLEAREAWTRARIDTFRLAAMSLAGFPGGGAALDTSNPSSSLWMGMTSQLLDRMEATAATTSTTTNTNTAAGTATASVTHARHADGAMVGSGGSGGGGRSDSGSLRAALTLLLVAASTPAVHVQSGLNNTPSSRNGVQGGGMGGGGGWDDGGGGGGGGGEEGSGSVSPQALTGAKKLASWATKAREGLLYNNAGQWSGHQSTRSSVNSLLSRSSVSSDERSSPKSPMAGKGGQHSSSPQFRMSMRDRYVSQTPSRVLFKALSY